MAGADKEPDPLRRRAGLLSALTRTYNEAYRLMRNRGTPEEVEQLRAKIEDRYTVYLESHEVTLVEYPDRARSILVKFRRVNRSAPRLVTLYTSIGSNVDHTPKSIRSFMFHSTFVWLHTLTVVCLSRSDILC